MPHHAAWHVMARVGAAGSAEELVEYTLTMAHAVSCGFMSPHAVRRCLERVGSRGGGLCTPTAVAAEAVAVVLVVVVVGDRSAQEDGVSTMMEWWKKD